MPRVHAFEKVRDDVSQGGREQMSKELKGRRNFTNHAAQHVSYFATTSETNNTSKPIPQVLQNPSETPSELSCVWEGLP